MIKRVSPMVRRSQRNDDPTSTSTNSGYQRRREESEKEGTNSSSTTTAGMARNMGTAANEKRSLSRIVMLRLLFVLSIAVAVTICTTVTLILMRDLELEVGYQTYESVTTSALDKAREIMLRKIEGGVVMDSILSKAFPDADTWPMVGLNGFYETANTVAAISGGTSIGLLVVVDPEEALEFEDHAQQHYRSQGYPDDAGVIELGFGIRRREANSTYGAVFDHSGEYSTYGSTNKVLTPVLDHSSWNSPMLMYNAHVSSTAIDSIINCSKPTQDPTLIGKHPNCTVVTGFRMSGPDKSDLIALIYKPIYPQNDPATLVGMLGLSVNFKDVLVSVIPNYVDDIVAVISTHSATRDHTTIEYDTVTFEIQNGHPVLLGEGDLHDEGHDGFARSIVLNDVATDASDTVVYTLTFYPKSFAQFQTKAPIAVAIGFGSVIIACCIVFFLYDYLVRSQSTQQKLAFDVKRRFVRYISHEIRTPLNTLCMGLDLLESDIRSHRPVCESAEVKMKASTVDDTALSFWYAVTRDIRESAVSAVGILDDLLHYDKIESGSLKLEVTSVNIDELVSKTVQKFKVQAANRQINLKLHLESSSAQQCAQIVEEKCHDEEAPRDSHDMHTEESIVVGDGIRLSQVICNLLSNSLKFTPVGGSVEVKLKHSSSPTRGLPRNTSGMHIICDRPLEGSVTIEVCDTGAGMTEDQLSKLFNEGIQFDANKLQGGGGSGLGLCISKGIVDCHNGVIGANSEGRGKGSTFFVELPTYKFEASELVGSDGSEKSEEGSDIASVSSTGHEPEVLETIIEDAKAPVSKSGRTPRLLDGDHRHILVVEDVDSSRKMLMFLLKRAGHTCVPACNGQEAIDAFSATQFPDQGMEPFDTILMDYQMPVLNGPDATEELRRLGCDSLIVGVTGNVLSEDVDFFKSKGADEVLPKPVSMARIDGIWEKYHRHTQTQSLATQGNWIDNVPAQGKAESNGKDG